jgi:hypothetical protein
MASPLIDLVLSPVVMLVALRVMTPKDAQQARLRTAGKAGNGLLYC